MSTDISEAEALLPPTNRHIRDLGPSLIKQANEPLSDYFIRLWELYMLHSEKFVAHRQWYEHKNEYGCRICTMNLIAGLALREGMKACMIESNQALPLDAMKDNTRTPIKC